MSTETVIEPVKIEKKSNFISVALEDTTKEAFDKRVPEGDRSKVIRHLVKMFLANEVKVVLPGTAEREI